MEDYAGENSASPLNIFPNPANSQIVVTLNNGCKCDDAATLTVTNVLGQVIYTQLLNLNSGALQQVVNLPENIVSGIYFVTVQSNKYIESKRLDVIK